MGILRKEKKEKKERKEIERIEQEIRELENRKKQLQEQLKQLKQEVKEITNINRKFHRKILLLRFLRWIMKGGVACMIFDTNNELVTIKYIPKGRNSFSFQGKYFEITNNNSRIYIYGMPTYLFHVSSPYPMIFDTEIEPKIKLHLPTPEEYQLFKQNTAIQKLLSTYQKFKLDLKWVIIIIGAIFFIFLLFIPI